MMQMDDILHREHDQKAFRVIELPYWGSVWGKARADDGEEARLKTLWDGRFTTPEGAIFTHSPNAVENWAVVRRVPFGLDSTQALNEALAYLKRSEQNLMAYEFNGIIRHVRADKDRDWHLKEFDQDDVRNGRLAKRS